MGISAVTWPHKGKNESSYRHLVSQPQSSISRLRRNPCNLRRFTGGGESISARKAHLRSIRSGETLEVQTVSKLPRLDTTITFSDFDMEGCKHPHEDPLVIKAIVANKTIHRVLVDNGSSADIIFASAFNKMGKLLPTWVLRRKSTALGRYS